MLWDQNTWPLCYREVAVSEGSTVYRDYLDRTVRKVDSTIHRINHFPADSVVCFVNTYPLDSDVSCGLRYPAFEYMGLGPTNFKHQKNWAKSPLRKIRFCVQKRKAVMMEIMSSTRNQAWDIYSPVTKGEAKRRNKWQKTLLSQFIAYKKSAIHLTTFDRSMFSFLA